MLPDLINGAFELLGGFFIWLSVRKIRASHKADGIHWGHMAFFSSWGFWNLFYYPNLGQWASFIGGLILVLVNVYYLWLVIYYSRRPTQHYIVEYESGQLDWLHGSLDDAKAIATRHALGDHLTWADGPPDEHGPTWVARRALNVTGPDGSNAEGFETYRIRQ